jgi:hypothetical protein
MEALSCAGFIGTLELFDLSRLVNLYVCSCRFWNKPYCGFRIRIDIGMDDENRICTDKILGFVRIQMGDWKMFYASRDSQCLEMINKTKWILHANIMVQ